MRKNALYHLILYLSCLSMTVFILTFSCFIFESNGGTTVDVIGLTVAVVVLALILIVFIVVILRKGKNKDNSNKNNNRKIPKFLISYVCFIKNFNVFIKNTFWIYIFLGLLKKIERNVYESEQYSKRFLLILRTYLERDMNTHIRLQILCPF